MLETGIILKTGGVRAQVSLPFKEGCSGCGKCTLGRGGKYMRIEAENVAGGRIGDEVLVEIPEKDPLTAAFILFGVPLLGLMAGGAAGYLLFSSWGSDPDAGAGIFGLMTMAGVFIMVRRREKRLMKKSGGKIRIVKILNQD